MGDSRYRRGFVLNPLGSVFLPYLCLPLYSLLFIFTVSPALSSRLGVSFRDPLRFGGGLVACSLLFSVRWQRSFSGGSVVFGGSVVHGGIVVSELFMLFGCSLSCGLLLLIAFLLVGPAWIVSCSIAVSVVELAAKLRFVPCFGLRFVFLFVWIGSVLFQPGGAHSWLYLVS